MRAAAVAFVVVVLAVRAPSMLLACSPATTTSARALRLRSPSSPAAAGNCLVLLHPLPLARVATHIVQSKTTNEHCMRSVSWNAPVVRVHFLVEILTRCATVLYFGTSSCGTYPWRMRMGFRMEPSARRDAGTTTSPSSVFTAPSGSDAIVCSRDQAKVAFLSGHRSVSNRGRSLKESRMDTHTNWKGETQAKKPRVRRILLLHIDALCYSVRCALITGSRLSLWGWRQRMVWGCSHWKTTRMWHDHGAWCWTRRTCSPVLQETSNPRSDSQQTPHAPGAAAMPRAGLGGGAVAAAWHGTR